MYAYAPESKIWIYQADQDMSPEQFSAAEKALQPFCSDWTAHDHRLHASFQIRHKRFIILIVDESHSEASGCSIDKSVAFLKKLGAELGLDFFTRTEMAYLTGEVTETIAFQDLNQGYSAGRFSDDTLFFNTRITRLEQLDTEFLLPFRQHWLYSRLSKAGV